LGRPGSWLIVYISVAAVTAAYGFALTATYFFFRPLRVRLPVALVD